MKIVCVEQFGPPDTLQFVEVENPSPQAGEVLVDIEAAGVGYVDALMIQGKYQVKPPLPYYPGSEFAGVVSQLGEGVTNLAIGAGVRHDQQRRFC